MSSAISSSDDEESSCATFMASALRLALVLYLWVGVEGVDGVEVRDGVARREGVACREGAGEAGAVIGTAVGTMAGTGVIVATGDGDGEPGAGASLLKAPAGSSRSMYAMRVGRLSSAIQPMLIKYLPTLDAMAGGEGSAVCQ